MTAPARTPPNVTEPRVGPKGRSLRRGSRSVLALLSYTMSPPKRSRGQTPTSSSAGIVPSRPIEALLAASLTTAVMLPQPGRNTRIPTSGKSLPASKSMTAHGSSSSLARTPVTTSESVPTTSASTSGVADAPQPTQPSSSRTTPTPPIRTRSPSPHHQYNTSFLSSEKTTSPKKPPKGPSSYASVGTMTAQLADEAPVLPEHPPDELVDAEETWCLSCPPNSLGFSTALALKENYPAKAKPRKIGRKADGARDYIGFATLPEQVHRKSVKRGFDFTLLVVGESGLGKSTLINSLFLGDLYRDRRIPDVAERIEKTTTIEKKSMDIEERGVKLRLTIVDTPGFGDGVNCEESWRACVTYVDDQFRQYFTDENGLNRRNLQDNRVHCCLYFVPPYGHGLRQIDVEFMRRLHRKVNIVPVLAKADTLTAAEVIKLKRQVLADIEENKIQIYQFPDCDSDEDEEFKAQDRELKACIPFAVVGSNTVLEVGGRKVRGRQYPWGVVEVENPKHSDFSKLRNMLITTHMQDLKDVTEDVHYENFRAQCISQISQQAIRERGSVKLKRDSGPPLDAAISETDRLLLQKDEEIRRMQDMLSQMQEKLKQSGNKRDSVVNV